MLDFYVQILGSSSALPTANRIPTSQVVFYNKSPFLIDCAEGTQIQLKKFNISLGRIKNIFISHLHGDHIYGIFGLLSSFNLLGRKQDLNIYGPQQLQNLYSIVLSLNNDELNYKINFYALKPDGKNLLLQNKHIEIYSFPLRHSKDVWGFSFEEKQKEKNIIKEYITKYNLSIAQIVKIKKGEDFITPDGKIIPNNELTIEAPKPRKYVFCTDTLPMKSLTKYFESPDLLYHEATFGDELKTLARETMHSTASQAAEVACELKAKKLVIGHFSTRYKNTKKLIEQASRVFPNVIEAYDGLIVKV